MSAKLANAPVYYALAQVRFNPVALMEKFANELQDHLRRSGYPIFETEVGRSIDFGDATNNQEFKPTITETPNWFFTSGDRNNGYVLGPDFLTFQTTNYLDHEEFFQSLCKGLDILNEIASIDGISRIGLRYLDAVVPEPGEQTNLFLHSQVQGVEFGLEPLGGSWESAYKTDQGILVAKIYKAVNSLLGFPVDLQPRSLTIRDKFVFSAPKDHAVIDLDHFSQLSLPMNADLIYENFVKLHAPLNQCFRALATEHAFSRWS
ncbi:TIGR04255 family protein [Pseudomonas mediterranea]|uniref:TIGR04255 family protein n=1 Tax=Pseudomonas mediterranea TaxID=183795 RepID=UPI003BF4F862